jgi:hypothetical protein
MKSAPIFLASKAMHVPSNSLSKDEVEDEEMHTPSESRLLKPAEVSSVTLTHSTLCEHFLVKVIIVDDLVKYRLFKESVWAAPQEDFLEEVNTYVWLPCIRSIMKYSQFYRLFGSMPISTLIQETISVSGEGNVKTAAQIRQLVLERLPLFLHDRVGKPTAFKFAWFKTPGNFVVRVMQVSKNFYPCS